MADGSDTKAGQRLLRRVILLSIFGGAGLWWCAYALSGYWWIADVLMSFSAYVGFVVCVGGCVGLVLWRSWRGVVVFVVSISVGLMCASDRRLFPEKKGAADRTYLEVVTMNLNMGNARVEELFGMLSGVGGDVLVLVEPRWEVFAAIKGGRDSLVRYPYRSHRVREGDVTSPMVILSRWPLERDEGVDSRSGVSVVVGRSEAEGGPFRLVGVHAHSPRGGRRWALGNDVIRGLVIQLEILGDQDGLPLLLAGDLNGGPMTYRDRMIRAELGLRRHSALFDPKSTFPSNPSNLGVLIDDIWGSDEFLSGSWSTIVIPGSDHRGVRAGLTMRAP